MPTTAKGTPYVVSTDLVANYPTVSSDLADHIDDNLAYNAVSINAQTGTTYTFALADASEGKLVTASNAASSTYTVPPQSSVTWANGAVLRILNQGAGVVTIAAGSGVTINGTPLTLAQYKGAAIQRTASNTWTFIPFAGGVGDAVLSNTPTGSYSSGGFTYNFFTFAASGTATVTTAGLADILVVGGGGGGAVAGGGGGQSFEFSSVYLTATGHTVTIGGGGAAIGATQTGNTGNYSAIGTITAVGGGGGGGIPNVNNTANGLNGGAGGGGGTAGGVSIIGGFAGGTNGGGVNASGGGGGAAGAGANGAGTTGGNGGAAISSSYSGSAVSYGGGGGGAATVTQGTGTGGGGDASLSGTAASGVANRGGGGGGIWNAGNSGAGGSGVVIIRVKV